MYIHNTYIYSYTYIYTAIHTCTLGSMQIHVHISSHPIYFFSCFFVTMLVHPIFFFSFLVFCDHTRPLKHHLFPSNPQPTFQDSEVTVPPWFVTQVNIALKPFCLVCFQGWISPPGYPHLWTISIVTLDWSLVTQWSHHHCQANLRLFLISHFSAGGKGSNLLYTCPSRESNLGRLAGRQAFYRSTTHSSRPLSCGLASVDPLS